MDRRLNLRTPGRSLISFVLFDSVRTILKALMIAFFVLPDSGKKPEPVFHLHRAYIAQKHLSKFGKYVFLRFVRCS
jgi:hypothetical protein